MVTFEAFSNCGATRYLQSEQAWQLDRYRFSTALLLKVNVIDLIGPGQGRRSIGRRTSRAASIIGAEQRALAWL
jgi:hypothetical protein